MKVVAWVAGLVGVAFAAIGLLPITGRIASSRDVEASTTRSKIDYLSQFAIRDFRSTCGRYPSSSEGLSVLFDCPPELRSDWKGPYVPGSTVHEMKEAWGRNLQYLQPGIHNPLGFDVWSVGKDGVQSADDIGNW